MYARGFADEMKLLADETTPDIDVPKLTYPAHVPCDECEQAVFRALILEQDELTQAIRARAIAAQQTRQQTDAKRAKQPSAAKHWILQYLTVTPTDATSLKVFRATHCSESCLENKKYDGLADPILEVYVVLNRKHREAWIRKHIPGVDRCVKGSTQQQADNAMDRSVMDRRCEAGHECNVQ